MKTFTVQLSYAAYYFREEVVEAETLEKALDKAVTEADASGSWSSTDTTGNTFGMPWPKATISTCGPTMCAASYPLALCRGPGWTAIVVTVEGGLI